MVPKSRKKLWKTIRYDINTENGYFLVLSIADSKLINHGLLTIKFPANLNRVIPLKHTGIHTDKQIIGKYFTEFIFKNERLS